jgi:DNA-binding beta-propeller fold protein YncE
MKVFEINDQTYPCRSDLSLKNPPLKGARGTFKNAGRSQQTNRYIRLCLLFNSCLLFTALIGCGPSASSPSKLFSKFETVGSFGTGPGQFNKPRSVAVDSRGNVFAVDMTGRVQRFDLKGNYQGSWQAPETNLGRPKGMGIDHEGRLMVVEPHYQRVTHFDFNGKPTRAWGKKGPLPGDLEFPRSVAADPKGNLFVCEYLQVQRIQKFDLQARFISSWGFEGSKPSEFRRPEGLTVDTEGNVYAADSCNHRVQKFSNDGKFLCEFGRAGKQLGELSYPYDVRVDREGTIYVCEFGNSRIQIFSKEGLPIETVGKEGTSEWEFRNPWGVALDPENNLWIADAMNHRLVKLSRRRNK